LEPGLPGSLEKEEQTNDVFAYSVFQYAVAG